jgi:CheY-like chemotaxis protein
LERFWLDPDDPIAVTEMEAGEWVKITVSDTGTGIPPDVLPHIYEPFFTTKPHGKGVGLGLPQVYGIVKQHEGAIDVKTVPDEGTTFIIYLPALTEDAMQQPAPTPQEIHRGSGEVILVVEDDHSAREVLVESLDFLNYRVLTATNGSEALEILCAQDEQNIALVLSDVIMPEMGGIALFYALKERGCLTKLVLLTGHTLDAQQPDELSKLEAAGLAGWLRKPPELSTLARVIHEALQNHQGD